MFFPAGAQAQTQNPPRVDQISPRGKKARPRGYNTSSSVSSSSGPAMPTSIGAAFQAFNSNNKN